MLLTTLQPGRRELGTLGERLPVCAVVTREHERMVRAYLRALTEDAACVDDLSQEVFVRAIERLDLFDALPGPSDSAGLLRGFARRVAFEHFRRKRRSRRYVDDTLETLCAQDDGVAAAVQRLESLGRLRDAVEDLPIVSRRMLEMRYHDGLDSSTIGERLGVSAGSVRVTLVRIRERLKARVMESE